ncbi:MAG TPA: hypothetical protein VH593_14255, partial [Ktedonobacteraceae bacterium]
MPKTKARKRGKDKSGSTQERVALPAQAGTRASSRNGRSSSKAPGSSNTQNLITSAMIALGFWGMSISFIFFYPDPNHYLYGGLVALMAVIWSFLVGIRV